MFKQALLLALITFSCLQAASFNGPTKLHLKVYDALTINGPAELNLVRAKSMEVNGTLQFKSLDISGGATITGTVNGTKGKFSELKVIGPIDVDHVICETLDVTGAVTASYLKAKNANIMGTLAAKNSEIENLTITTESFSLDDTLVTNIIVKKSENSKEQKLVLRGKTIVNGTITFESGNGIIHKGDDVQLKGTITGTKSGNL